MLSNVSNRNFGSWRRCGRTIALAAIVITALGSVSLRAQAPPTPAAIAQDPRPTLSVRFVKVDTRAEIQSVIHGTVEITLANSRVPVNLMAQAALVRDEVIVQDSHYACIRKRPNGTWGLTLARDFGLTACDDPGRYELRVAVVAGDVGPIVACVPIDVTPSSRSLVLRPGEHTFDRTVLRVGEDATFSLSYTIINQAGRPLDVEALEQVSLSGPARHFISPSVKRANALLDHTDFHSTYRIRFRRPGTYTLSWRVGCPLAHPMVGHLHLTVDASTPPTPTR